MAEKKGRKVFSKGVWAPAATIERIRAELEAERATEGFAKRKEADARRRVQAQAEYVEDFLGAVVSSWPFMRITPILATELHEQSPIMPRRSGAARSPGPSVFLSSSGPKLP